MFDISSQLNLKLRKKRRKGGKNLKALEERGSRRGGLMVSALVPGLRGLGSSSGLGHCCILGQDTLLSQCLSTQEYKWVLVNCWGNLTNCGGVAFDELASRPGGGVEILLATSCRGNQVTLQQL